MQQEEYTPKMQAVTEVMQIIGCSRYIVERRIDELVEQGKITVRTAQTDYRKKLLSRKDIETIIDSLRM